MDEEKAEAEQDAFYEDVKAFFNANGRRTSGVLPWAISKGYWIERGDNWVFVQKWKDGFLYRIAVQDFAPGHYREDDLYQIPNQDKVFPRA